MSKKAIKIGVSANFWKEKKSARKFSKSIIGPSWRFLRRTQLGPIIDFNLAQLLTLKMALFPFFAFKKRCWNTYFYSVFCTSTKICPKNGPPQNDNFLHFAKHRFIKKPVLLQLPFWPKIGVFQLGFFETKNKDVEQKHTFKSAKKTKRRKRDFKEKRRQETKKKKYWWRKTLYINLSDVVLFMKQKQRRKKRKERDKNKEAKESKKERQEGKEKGTRSRERQRKKNWKRGRPKKGRGRKKEKHRK